MNRSGHQNIKLRLSALMSSSPDGQLQRRQFVEVLKIIGSITLLFGGVAWLLSGLANQHRTDKEVEELVEQGVLANSIPGDAETQQPVEVYVGEFTSTQGSASAAARHPDGEGVQVVEFEVFAVMQGTYESAVRLQQHLKQFHYRVRETMNIAVRSASEQELADPDARSLRENIRKRLNHMLDKPLFEEVVFTDYQVYEF